MSNKYNWIVDFPQSVSNPKYQSKKGKTVPVFYTPNAITLIFSSNVPFSSTFYLTCLTVYYNEIKIDQDFISNIYSTRTPKKLLNAQIWMVKMTQLMLTVNRY